jgi:hypothetical protein
MADQFLFSGEPLPLAPNRDDDPELAAFHTKLLDYLRRLTQKISASEVYGGASVATVETFAAALTGDQTMANNAWDGIVWTDPLRRDSYYTHDKDDVGEQITLVNAGLYLMHLDVQTDDPNFSLRIANGDGDGLAYSLYNDSLELSHTGAIACPFFSAAGGIVEAQILFPDAASDVIAGYTRITILYLGTLDGTGGVPGVDPGGDDGPWWKFTL